MTGNITIGAGAQNVQTFGTQDATITDASITVSKYPMVKYGTTEPIIDPATGQPKPKRQLVISLRGDDGKTGRVYLGGVDVDANDPANYVFSPRGGAAAFIRRVQEFGGKTITRVSDLKGIRVAVAPVPPTGQATTWKLTVTGPAQSAAPPAPVASAPSASALAARLAPKPKTFDAAAEWAKLPADTQAQVRSSVDDPTLPEVLVELGIAPNATDASALIAYAKGA